MTDSRPFDAPSDTPSDTVADRRTHPATVPLQFLKSAPSMILGVPAAVAVMSRGNWNAVLAGAVVVGAAAIMLYWLAWRSFRYGVGARDIVIESGVLTRTRRSIPFDRIHDVDIERGPLQRVFGLAKVRIETGGAAADEGLIDSVTLAQADALRAAVRAGKQVEDAAASAADAAQVRLPELRTMYAMAVPRVLAAGLFNFSLLYLAGLFGLLQTFKNLLPFDIYDPGRWLGLVDERLGENGVRGLGLGAIAAVLVVALVAGVLFGVARTVATDYGFRLTVEGVRFRRTRGLFTRSDVVIPKRRVQLALVSGGPLRGAFQWSVLHFQTLSGAAAAGQRQSMAPLATTLEIATILAEQGDLHLPDAASLQRVSARHIVRVLLGNTLLPVLVILAAATQYPPALFALLLVPLLVALAFAERRSHAYALTPDLLFIRRGVWRRQLWIIPTVKAQALTLTRTILQRPLGLATLAVDTAGGPGINGPAIVDLRLARARELLRLLADARTHSGRKSGTDR